MFSHCFVLLWNALRQFKLDFFAFDKIWSSFSICIYSVNLSPVPLSCWLIWDIITDFFNEIFRFRQKSKLFPPLMICCLIVTNLCWLTSMLHGEFFLSFFFHPSSFFHFSYFLLLPKRGSWWAVAEVYRDIHPPLDS